MEDTGRRDQGVRKETMHEELTFHSQKIINSSRDIEFPWETTIRC